MKCIHCHRGITDVKDSRAHRGNVRRRRTCRSCGKSFYTLEVSETEVSGPDAGLYQERLVKSIGEIAFRLNQLSLAVQAIRVLTGATDEPKP